MIEKIWRFQGKLQENENRVITQAEGSVTEIEEGKSPELEVSANEGKLIIDLKVPTKKVLDSMGVGKQYLVDGSDTSTTGQKYGEIFNDYANNVASGIYSHAGGFHTEAKYPYQTVLGKYNNNMESSVFEIGYGDDIYNKKNVFRVDKSGNVIAMGDIKNGEGISLNSLDRDKISNTDLNFYIAESQARIHRYTNKDSFTVSGETTISQIEFLTTEATTPLYWATAGFTLSDDAVVTINYYIQDVLQSDDTLQQNFSAGKNFLTLFNIFDIKEDFGGTLRVTMKVSNGTASIGEFCVKSALYVQGVGITAAWNGRINVTDNIKKITLNNEIQKVSKFKEDIKITQYIPIPNNIRQRIPSVSLNNGGIKVTGIRDFVEVGEIVLNYIFNTSKAQVYLYNKNYIKIEDNKFKINTQYTYPSVESSIDVGKILTVKIPTDDKISIERIDIINV